MSNQSIRDRIIEKLHTFSEQQLESVWQTIENLESKSGLKKSNRHTEKLAANFDLLCQETSALHTNNPITNEEIQAEIDAYRRGE